MNNYNSRRNNNRGGYRSYRSASSHDFRRRGNGRNPQRVDESKYIKKIDVDKKVEKYVAKISFDSLKINNTLKRNVIKKGFTSPTPIQDQAIPHILVGKDLVGIANTGTGKTVAFLLPLIEKTIKNRQSKVIIIAPTRELAGQINDELYALSRDLNVYSVLCTGGTSLYKQINNIRRGFSFIVGTPGRLKDLTDKRVLNLKYFDTVVLDEVDRMLDMGFVEDIKYIIAQLGENRQSLFFSATMDHNVERIMKLILHKDYETVSVKTGETSANVEQDVIRIRNKDERFPKLNELLKTEALSKVLIFVNTKRGVEKLCRNLREQGHKTDSIHGDRKQRERQRAIDGFKNNRIDILIATDVAARGIDISGVSHVINYEVPNSYQDYIHRIGRTGRADQKGIALTFIESNRA